MHASLLIVYSRALILDERRVDAFLVTELLEVAKQYEMDAVRPFVVRQLEKAWPTTLVGWLRQHGEFIRLTSMRDPTTGTVGGKSLDDLFPEPAGTIHVATQHEITSVLPAAFYCLSDIALEDDWIRWHANNGKWDLRQDRTRADQDPRAGWRRTARWTVLDAKDLRRVFIDQKVLQQYKATLSVKVLHFKPQVPSCRYGAAGSCGAELALLQQELKPPPVAHGNPGPLAALCWMQTTFQQKPTALCDLCRCLVAKRINDEMEMVWSAAVHQISRR